LNTWAKEHLVSDKLVAARDLIIFFEVSGLKICFLSGTNDEAILSSYFSCIVKFVSSRQRSMDMVTVLTFSAYWSERCFFFWNFSLQTLLR
jgi:hypothetical protein